MWLSEQNHCCALRDSTHLPQDSGHDSVKKEFPGGVLKKKHIRISSLRSTPFPSAPSPSTEPLLLLQPAWACYGHRRSPDRRSGRGGASSPSSVFRKEGSKEGRGVVRTDEAHLKMFRIRNYKLTPSFWFCFHNKNTRYSFIWPIAAIWSFFFFFFFWSRNAF